MAPEERDLGRNPAIHSCSLDREVLGQEQDVAERAASEERLDVQRRQEVKRRDQEVPEWLRLSREQLGETPQFLIGTGCHKSKRIGGLWTWSSEMIYSGDIRRDNHYFY